MKILKYLFIFLPLLTFAQIPEYYSSIDFTQTGDDLKDQLTTLITNTHTNPLYYTSSYYTDTWDAMKQGDLDPTNSQNVLLTYGYDDNDGVYQTDRTRDKDLSCHTSSCYGLWNREHTFAKSLATPPLTTEEPSAGTDAHNLRACDSQMNSSRSNREFETGTGDSHITGTGNWYPGDEWRGDVARIIMYMYTRYPTQCLPLNIGIGTASNSNNGDMPDVFLEWNILDPVSQLEINRNNIFEILQGNRNPYIDNPYLATIIWNGDTAEDTWNLLSNTSYTLENISIYPTITSDYIYVDNPQNIVYTYTIYSAQGQVLDTQNTLGTIDLRQEEKGFYFIHLSSNNQHKTYKIILQ